MQKAIALLVITMSSLAACDRPNSNSGQPTSPSAPTPPAPTSPSAPTPAGFRLSGVVFEGTPSGLRPVPGGGVFFWFESSLGGRVEVDTSGRYTISGLPAGRFVRVTWTPSAEDIGLHQPCPANATIAGDTEQDIEVVRLGSREFTYGSPILSGVVFEETPSGRRPLMGARVLYYINRTGRWVRRAHANRRQRALPVLWDPTRGGEGRGRRLQRRGHGIIAG